MTVKDQIPTFPELVDFYRVMCEVAHGTTDRNRWNYYSNAEQEYAEELATTKIMTLIREGHIRTTGRLSQTKKGTAKRWEAQQYKQHSKVRTYIKLDFWRTAVLAKSYLGFRTARTEVTEYTDIMLVFDDCVKHLAADVLAHKNGVDDPGDKGDGGTIANDYSTPYIDLMWRAIDHFKISTDNQPIKDTLVEWFLSQEIEGQKLSKATAEYLASFVRLPASRLGGNRPWKVRALQVEQQPK